MRTTADFVVPDPPPWRNTDTHLKTALSAPAPDLPPCADCLAACCWFVLLETGSLEDSDDLDWIAQHLDYDRTVLWVDPAGRYTLGAISLCRHFDRQNCTCSVHGTTEQPQLCRLFDAHACWYRNALRDDRRWLIRVNGPRWPAFRERVLLEEDGAILSFLDRRPLPSSPRTYTVPATLELELPSDMVSSPDPRGDLLLLLSGFEGVRLARTPKSWVMQLDTHRDVAVPARSIEATPGQIWGFAPHDVFTPNTHELADLVGRLGAGIFDQTPDEVRKESHRSDSDSLR